MHTVRSRCDSYPLPDRSLTRFAYDDTIASLLALVTLVSLVVLPLVFVVLMFSSVWAFLGCLVFYVLPLGLIVRRACRDRSPSSFRG